MQLGNKQRQKINWGGTRKNKGRADVEDKLAFFHGSIFLLPKTIKCSLLSPSLKVRASC